MKNITFDAENSQCIEYEDARITHAQLETLRRMARHARFNRDHMRPTATVSERENLIAKADALEAAVRMAERAAHRWAKKVRGK